MEINDTEKEALTWAYLFMRKLVEECKTISELLANEGLELVWGDEPDAVGESYGIGFDGCVFTVNQMDGELDLECEFEISAGEDRRPQMINITDLGL